MYFLTLIYTLPTGVLSRSPLHGAEIGLTVADRSSKSFMLLHVILAQRERCALCRCSCTVATTSTIYITHGAAWLHGPISIGPGPCCCLPPRSCQRYVTVTGFVNVCSMCENAVRHAPRSPLRGVSCRWLHRMPRRPRSRRQTRCVRIPATPPYCLPLACLYMPFCPSRLPPRTWGCTSDPCCCRVTMPTMHCCRATMATMCRCISGCDLKSSRSRSERASPRKPAPC